MVIAIVPFANCIDHLQKDRTYEEIIYMSPDGQLLDQPLANSLSLKQDLLILCGHYKGIDERIREPYVTREIPIRNYVLSRGEPPAAFLVNTVVRLLPGDLSDATSALPDPSQKRRVEPPCYTPHPHT